MACRWFNSSSAPLLLCACSLQVAARMQHGNGRGGGRGRGRNPLPSRCGTSPRGHACHCRRHYFHYSFLLEQKLDPEGRYVFVEFPHGAFPIGERGRRGAVMGYPIRHAAGEDYPSLAWRLWLPRCHPSAVWGPSGGPFARRRKRGSEASGARGAASPPPATTHHGTQPASRPRATKDNNPKQQLPPIIPPPLLPPLFCNPSARTPSRGLPGQAQSWRARSCRRSSHT